MSRMPCFRSVIVPTTLLVLAFSGLSLRAEGLHFAEPQARAGDVLTGRPLSHRFTFVNDTSAPVTVTELRANCGCMTPRLEPAGNGLPHVYSPGERGAILLEVSTLSQSAGSHTWRITAAYQTQGRSFESIVELTGQITSEVTVQPAALTMFTDKAVGHELFLTDLRRKPLVVTEVHSTSPKINGRVLEEFQDTQGHWVQKIGLEIDADYPEGRHEETVDIVTTDPFYRDLKVPVTVVKRGRQRVSASPAEATFPADAGQELPARLVRVRDADNQKVVVEQVVADHPAIVCQWAQGPENLATVKVRIVREQLTTETLHSSVHIHLSQPLREVITIPVALE